MTFEKQLNILLKFIKENKNYLIRDLFVSLELNGVEINKCLQKLTSDGYVQLQWPRAKPQEKKALITRSGELFLEHGGYGTGNSYNKQMLIIAIIAMITAILSLIVSFVALFKD